jgi:Ca2+-binding EF-hand superfamily protein
MSNHLPIRLLGCAQAWMLVVGCFVFEVSGASAQQPEQGCCKKSKGVLAHGGNGVGRNFKVLDLDGDGFLSFEEFSKSKRLVRMPEVKRRKLFDYLDRNKDAKLDLRELRPAPPSWMVALRKEFSRLDKDQTGALDFVQFTKSSQIAKMNKGDQIRLFRRLDQNKDQRIRMKELSKIRHRGCPEIDLKKYDTNRSGGLDFDQFSKIPWVSRIPEERRKKVFGKIDLDKDGEISPREIRRSWGARRKHGPPRARPHGPHYGPPHGRSPHGKPLRGKPPHGKPPHGSPCPLSEEGSGAESSNVSPVEM